MSDSENITVTITAVVDKHWIEYCVKYPDLFASNYCGYWLSGLEHDDNLGWLCYVSMEIDGEPSIREITEREDYSSIVQKWKDSLDLPKGFYRLDKDAAIRAFKAGIERDGLEWYEDGDSLDYDCVIQMALLGEIRYG